MLNIFKMGTMEVMGAMGILVVMPILGVMGILGVKVAWGVEVEVGDLGRLEIRDLLGFDYSFLYVCYKIALYWSLSILLYL